MASRKILEISHGEYTAKIYHDKPRYFFGIRLYHGKSPIGGGWEYFSYESTRQAIESKALAMVRQAYQERV